MKDFSLTKQGCLSIGQDTTVPNTYESQSSTTLNTV